MRLYKLLSFVALASLVVLISQLMLEVYLNHEEPWLFPVVQYESTEDLTPLFEEVRDPVLVWWAPIGGMNHYRSLIKCGRLSCFFTSIKQFRRHHKLKGFLFYGTYINWTDLPLPRGSEFWGLLHEESPRNNIPLGHKPAITLFNYTSTFSRHSDVPTTSQFLYGLELLTDMKYFVPAKAKTAYQRNESWLLAPVVYIQSDCSTPIDRDSYVLELAKHIRIDSFGHCLHNRSLPPHLQAPFNLKTMMSDDLQYIVGKYKFALAIENGICDDYITEKLWRPLISGTVPVYIGSPSVSDWLPNNHSAILGLDFESPKHLAEHLHYLDKNHDEYDKYRSHKLKSSVTNPRLLNEMKTRDYAPLVPGRSFISKFECFMCEKAHAQSQEEISIASTEHYSCDMPRSLLTGKPNVTNYWLESWFQGRCQAQVVRKFIDSGRNNYTEEELNSGVLELFKQKKCSYSEENEKELNLERFSN